MKNNQELQTDVQNAIKIEPLLHAAEIGVTVKDGIITLVGSVDSYAKKLEAENAAKNVMGVKAIVENITVTINSMWKKDDNAIASEILNALKWNWSVPNNTVTVKVENGWVTIGGEQHWNYQRVAAKNAVSNLLGVVGVTNNITIKGEAEDKIEKEDIETAIARNWSINDENIDVEVEQNNVTLSGSVSSYYQKEEAERLAWKVKGVWNVNNELTIDWID